MNRAAVAEVFGLEEDAAPFSSSGIGSAAYRRTERSLRAFPITETELSAMASAATIGLSKRPRDGLKNPGGNGNAGDVADKRERQVLPDIAHRRPA